MSVRNPADNSTGPAPGLEPTPRRRGWWITASSVLALLIVLIVVAAVMASNNASPQAVGISVGSTPSPQPATDPSASPAPSQDPSPVPSVAQSPAPDAAVPAPTEAAVAEPAPPAAQAPVPLTDTVAAVPGVVFSIDTLESVDGVARGPGEVGGPSLRFTVAVRNDTPDTVSLTSTIVNLFFGPEQSPATELSASGGSALPDSVAPGATQQGVFVFTVPTDQRDQVRIAVDYSLDVPIVLFEGPAPS